MKFTGTSPTAVTRGRRFRPSTPPVIKLTLQLWWWQSVGGDGVGGCVGGSGGVGRDLASRLTDMVMVVVIVVVQSNDSGGGRGDGEGNFLMRGQEGTLASVP